MGETLQPPTWARAVLAELLPQPGALGDFLAPLEPSERLSTLLRAIDPTEVDDFSLVEVIAAHKRMEAWSAAQAARAAAVLAERDSLNPTWPSDTPGHTRGESVVGQELSMRLRITKQAATKMAACGRAFDGMFEPTGELLERGLIDWPRAQAIITTLTKLPAEVALAAQWDVLPKAPGRTLRQVQQDLEKAVIAVDPDSADQRHIAARQQRCVYRPRPLPDGMAILSARLPAADAIAMDLALDASARAAKHNGDARTLDQLRADSLALMAHTALTLGYIGPHANHHCPCGCQDHTAQAGTATQPSADDSRPQPSDTASLTAEPSENATPPTVTDAPSTADAPPSDLVPLTSADAPPSDPAPLTAANTPPPDPAPLTTVDTPSTDPAPLPTADAPPPDIADSTPSDTEPPSAADASPLDQASPSGLAAPPGNPPPPAGDPAPPATPAPRRVVDGPPLPGHRLPGGALPTIRVGMIGGGRADIGVLIPLNVLQPQPRQPGVTALDRDPEPVAELDGYGPIPPIIARALATGGTWRRLLTDPATGQVLDVGRTRYQPPAAIADHVRHRDRTCIVPGCTHPARTADLDHIHEWHHGGTTSADNLGPQCTTDHRAKTIGALTVAYATDRTYAWTTPTGHGYLRRPDGTTIPLPRHTATKLRQLVKNSERHNRPVDPATIDTILAAISIGEDPLAHWAEDTAPTEQAPKPEVAWATAAPPF
ncbi:DUF222 domain-containing protein [Georgenia phoenicis]